MRLAIREGGETVLLVEQNAAESLKLANRGYVIELGKVVTYGNSKELLENEEVKKAYISM
jgi:branched-chain amino acid transport system ATP-binding protein